MILVRNTKIRRKKLEGFLSIKESILKYMDGAQAKFGQSASKIFVKAIFAGMMIAMGASASSVAAHTVGDVGLARLVAGVVFPVGLMMVVLLGAELFTGDCLMVMNVVDRRAKTSKLIKILVLVYLGNFVGANLLAWCISMSGQLNYSAGLLGAYTIKVAVGKANISFGTALISGILCNILVCAAVLMATCAKDITGKLVAIFFTIMLFVVSGFEHCVANMYYISAGIIANHNPEYSKLAMEKYGCTAEQLQNLDISHYLVSNLLPVTIGNIIGGIVFLGLPLYYLNVSKKEKVWKE